MARPKCPYCQCPAKLVSGMVVFPARPSLAKHSYWQCVRCGARVGCHPKSTAPLGELADGKTRFMRAKAHEEFDRLWKGGLMGRQDAYRWLREQLGLGYGECHIGMFDAAMCQRVIDVCRSRGKRRAA